MMQKLKDKSAVITGGGSGGIGRAVAMAMAEEGAKVVVNDIGRNNAGKMIADEVVAEITKNNGTAVPNYDSVITMEGGEKIIKSAIDNFGRIDILVNCAGNKPSRSTLDMTDDDWNSVLNVHLKGHFNCIKAALPSMIKQQSGTIVNISSRGAFFGGPGSVAYSSAKAGILGLTSSIASEFKGNGINVNAILPSADTKLFPGNKPRPLGDNIPSSIFLDPDYIAPLIVFLGTNEAKKITGHFIYASGGDLCIYARPLHMMGGSPIFIRKAGKWTVDELANVIPATLGTS
jgi:NAD(P)-dependent dehydrogenase (short-subunit alcohol dehydrogenase family)